MVREVSQRVDCSVGTVHTIIHDNLNMRRLYIYAHDGSLKCCGVLENSKDGVMPAFCSAIPTRRGRFSQ